MRKDAAVCIIQNLRGEFLFLLRNSAPFGWGLAGGKIEEGETPLEGAIREIREETSLIITEPTYLGERESVTGRKVSVYHAVYTGDNKDVQISKEHDNFCWTYDPMYYLVLAGNTKEFLDLIPVKNEEIA